MTIDNIFYIKNGSQGEGQEQSISTFYWMAKILPKLRNKKIEHLNWVGLIDNLFLEDPTPYALVFYSGKWSSTEIVDRLILDIKDPYSDDEEFPSPFSDKFLYLKGNRTKFIELLKGENIF